MRKIIPSLLFILLIISHLNVFSQDTLAHTMVIDGNYTHGFLIAHRPLIYHLQQEKVNGIELASSWQTDGSKDWHHLYNFPKTGVSLSIWNLGNREQLGLGVSLIPYVDFPLIQSKRNTFYLKFGWGIGYVEKPFDADDNYKNVAVGTKMNFSLILQPHYEIKINNNFSLNTGISLVHYSNGSVTTPNLGLNLIGLTAGIGYKLGDPVVKPEQRKIDFKKSKKITFFGAASVKQIYPADGETYFAATISGTRSWQLTRKSAFGGGFDVFYDNSLYYKIEDKNDTIQSDFDAVRIGIHGGYEMIFSKISLVINMGVYLYSQYYESNMYHRFGLRYQLPRNLFATVNIKSHWGKADFAEFGIGYRINK